MWDTFLAVYLGAMAFGFSFWIIIAFSQRIHNWRESRKIRRARGDA